MSSIQQYHASDVLYKQYNSLWCMHKSAQYVPRPRKRQRLIKNISLEEWTVGYIYNITVYDEYWLKNDFLLFKAILTVIKSYYGGQIIENAIL